jgi:multidrug efflux pump subunit AcrA (membrane-fusion protein)
MKHDIRSKFSSTAIGGLILLAVLLVGAVALPSLRRLVFGSLDSPDHDAVRPVQVEAVRVLQTTLHPSLDLVGQIVAVPERTAVVSSQAGGWVDRVTAIEGQQVRAGETLLALDARLAGSDLRRAQATLAEKQAALARLKQGNLPEEIDTAREERDGARATVEGLESELSALQDLVARKEISQVQYVSKRKALETAQAALSGAEAKLHLMEHGPRPEAIAEAQAQVDAATADVKAAELAVEWCTIRSPIDGFVVQLDARRGQFLDRAAALAKIIDLSQLFAQLRIPSDSLAAVRKGTAVDVRVAAFPNDVFRGQVARLSGEADASSGDLTAYVSVDNADGRLRPGLSCTAHVWLTELKDALAVPVSAVADHSGTRVVTLIQDGKATEVPVTVGVAAEGLVQITNGLSAGDMVATKGGYGLPEGYPVEIVSQEAPARPKQAE